MPTLWIAWRLVKEIFRDKRTLLFFFIAPLIVMTLIYYALLDTKPSKLTVLARGTSRLFVGEIVSALEREKDITLTSRLINDNISDTDQLVKEITSIIKAKKTDGVLLLGKELIEDRSKGERGQIRLFVDGSRPTTTGQLISAIAESMDELSEAMPSMGDENCTNSCLESINAKSIDLEKNYLYTNEDYDHIDYYLPMFPAFFAFFFTFITVTITFQRERLSGTLERLLAGPVSFRQVVFGYMLGFFLFAFVQAVIILAFIFNLIAVPMELGQYGSIVFVTGLTIITALLMGLFASYFSANEFQAMQFIPLIILPQIFLGDMIWNINDFPKIFQYLANLMPLTYANRMIRQSVTQNIPLLESWPSILAFITFFLVLLIVLLGANKKHTGL